MRNVAIVYDTRTGQTEKIALFMQRSLEESGCVVEIYDLHQVKPTIGPQIDGVILGCPVYAGRFRNSLRTWVRRNKESLRDKRVGFFLVALNTADKRESARADDDRLLREFIEWIGLVPDFVMNVAGALKYTHYFFLIRWQMKRIARRAGGDTDTSRDFEYTDWGQVRRFCEDFSRQKTSSPFTIASRFPSLVATKASLEPLTV